MDAFGNDADTAGALMTGVATADLSFTSALVAQEIVPTEARISYASAGLYEGRLRVTRSGKYVLAVTIRDAHISGSPFKVDVTSGSPDPSLSVLLGTGYSSAFSGEVYLHLPP